MKRLFFELVAQSLRGKIHLNNKKPTPEQLRKLGNLEFFLLVILLLSVALLFALWGDSLAAVVALVGAISVFMAHIFAGYVYSVCMGWVAVGATLMAFFVLA